MTTTVKVTAIMIFLASLLIGGFWIGIGSLVVMWVVISIIGA